MQQGFTRHIGVGHGTWWQICRLHKWLQSTQSACELRSMSSFEAIATRSCLCRQRWCRPQCNRVSPATLGWISEYDGRPQIAWMALKHAIRVRAEVDVAFRNHHLSAASPLHAARSAFGLIAALWFMRYRWPNSCHALVSVRDGVCIASCSYCKVANLAHSACPRYCSYLRLAFASGTARA